MTYRVIVQFIDGSNMTLDGVTKHGIYDSDCYYVTKNGYDILYNKDCVKYIGRTFDIEVN